MNDSTIEGPNDQERGKATDRDDGAYRLAEVVEFEQSRAALDLAAGARVVRDTTCGLRFEFRTHLSLHNRGRGDLRPALHHNIAIAITEPQKESREEQELKQKIANLVKEVFAEALRDLRAQAEQVAGVQLAQHEVAVVRQRLDVGLLR